MSRCLLALCLCVAAAHAGAEDTPPMTREELAACLADERRLHAENEALTTRRTALNAELEHLKALEARIEADKTRLDDTDATAVAAYNALIDEHQAQAEAFNAKLPAVNADIAALNTARDAFDTRCAHRAYDERDLEALRQP